MISCILGIFENILEMQPELALRVIEECEILSWLLIRLKASRLH